MQVGQRLIDHELHIDGFGGDVLAAVQPEGAFTGCSFTARPAADARIPGAMAEAWRSGFSERLLAYRREQCMAAVPRSAPAVIVQCMVNAEAAGVAFSADPVSGRRGVAVVSAVFGLATALVSGESDADVYEVDRTEKVLRVSVGGKESNRIGTHEFVDFCRRAVIASSLQIHLGGAH